MATPETWAIVGATICGPIAAVLISAWHQERSKRNNARYYTFAEMMKHRRALTSPEFVGPFNLVPVFFADEDNVTSRYRTVMKVLNEPGWQVDAHGPLLLRQLEKEMTLLLEAMAVKVGVKIDQLEILDAGYSPMHWANDLMELREIRQVAKALLSGEASLRVTLEDKAS